MSKFKNVKFQLYNIYYIIKSTVYVLYNQTNAITYFSVLFADCLNCLDAWDLDNNDTIIGTVIVL